METYQRFRHTAVIDGPVVGASTHGQVRVSLFRVVISGRIAYHAPSRDLCRDWLVRHGFRPVRRR
jgi:hypothetical protein